jgi:hypothetical protein
MRADRTKAIRWISPLVALAALAGGHRAVAGPGSYDPATRSFNLTYTYAVVPSAGMMPDQLDQLGQVRPVSQDQDAKVRGYFAAVSDKLWQATNQRGKIGRFTCVDNVKQADVIVSPTGRIGRGGFATPGGFEDRQGHLVVSYEDLTQSGRDIDAQLTVFHELCHYLFALPDEYRDGERVGMCPLQNGSGPGCLMDNYWFDGPRHGWYGRFCHDDHNARAPLPQTIISGQSAQQPCQQLIDLFFQSHLKGEAAANPPPDTGGEGAGTSGAGGDRPTPDEPFTGIFESLVDATGSFLRSLIQDARDAGKTAPSAGSLRSRADKFLRSQVAFGRQTARLTLPTPDQIKRGIEMAVQSALSTRLSAPDRFTGPFVAQLVEKAREIAAKELGKPGGAALAASPLSSGAAARTRAMAALQRRIETELLPFARQALGLADRDLPSDQRAFSLDERAFIKQVAGDAASQSGAEDNSPLGQYFAAAKIHIRISEMIARMSLDTRDELGVPGTDILRTILSDYERQMLKQYALPGSPYRGFGLRRTVIFAPMPVDPGRDRVPLQASPSYDYSSIRKVAIAAVSSLITRERTIIVPDDMTPAIPFDVRNLEATDRMRLVRQEITFLTDQVRRNRFDNIIAIMPPGGLPEDLGDELESLRKRMALSPDVRLDIVSVDTGNVPQRLIDLCARSRGSWVFAFDLDSLGAVGQRLRGEGLSGSWVIVPEQGRLDLTPTDRRAGGAVGNAPPDPARAPRELPLRFRRNRLFLFNNLPGADNPGRAELQGFLAGRRRGMDDRRIALLRVLEEYRADMATDPFRKGTPGLGDVYANLYNSSFFRTASAFLDDPQGQAVPVTPEQIAAALDAGRGVGPNDLPSLATLRADLRALGDDLKNVDDQDEYTRKILPTIARLDALRADLDGVYEALRTVDVKDTRRLKQALDLAIRARRDLGDLPHELADPRREAMDDEFTSSIDRLHRSKGLRQAIEAAILERLRRFDQGERENARLAQRAINDPSLLGQLADAEREVHAYVELIQVFSQLFRNLHKYDTIQAREGGGTDDPFAELARKLDGRPRGGQGPIALWSFINYFPTVEVVPAPASQLYLQLLAEIYLDLTDLEIELSRGDWITPTYERVPRKSVSIVPLAHPAGGPAEPVARPQGLAGRLLAEDPQLGQVLPLELAPFTAEEKASFDLIVGFTRSMRLVENLDADDRPTLRLYSRPGADADEQGAPFLHVDPAKSTDHMLVFRLPYPNRDAGRIAKGTYYPRLQLQQKHLPERGGQVDYTFSVASANPRVVLTASLRQVAIRADTDEENDDEVANRGIIARSKSAAVIEAMVTAGSPVRGVDVRGYYQQFEVGGGPVTSPALTFLDDGVWPDTTENDGVYTAKITLDPQGRRKQAIYQVMVEARSNDKASFVPTEKFQKPDTPPASSPTTRSRRAMAPKPPEDTPAPAEVPKFQRATSVNFLVEGAGGPS